MTGDYYSCSICGKRFRGYSNMSEPVAPGRCCNLCYVWSVLPIRVGVMLNGMKSRRPLAQVLYGGSPYSCPWTNPSPCRSSWTWSPN